MTTGTEVQINVNEVSYEYAIKIALISNEAEFIWIEMCSYTDLSYVIEQINEEFFLDFELTERNFWDKFKIVAYQGFENFDVKHWAIEKLARLVELIEDEQVNAEAFSYFETQHDSTDLDDVFSSYQDALFGIFDSKSDLVQQYIELYHPELKDVLLMGESVLNFICEDNIFEGLQNSGEYDIEYSSKNELMVFNTCW